MSDPKTSPPLSLDTELPLLPLRRAVLFPGVVSPFELARPKTVALAEHVAKEPDALVAVFSQRDASTDEPAAADLHPVGTVARVVGVAAQGSGVVALVLRGVARVELETFTTTGPFFTAKVKKIEEIDASDDELEALLLSLRDTTRQVVDLLPALPKEVIARIDASVHAGELADFVAQYMEATTEEKVELLAMRDVKERARAVLNRLVRRLEVLKMRERINAQVKDEMGKTQREHVLRQQLKAIQAELEGDDEADNDLDAVEKRIADAKLPQEAHEVATKQLKRLRAMQPGSPEHAMVRNYLDWILDLPWTEATRDNPDIAAVRAVLDADHYGLEKVKKRILEYLAVRKLKSDKKGPILCLIGPPGVGKTSLGRSISRALGRKFHRISLGGVHDEAAIRGHRRTYVGALPGNILQGMKKVGTTNPVLMLDEVDKLGHDGLRGDPASALLEVLDPEQNDTFTDHYLEIPYDLSNVMFIANANVGDTIPAPLRDRMEIIEIPGYTRHEKLAIARRHLVPKQLSEHGIGADKLDITDEALELLIDRYTREAGVRSLEKKIAAIVRGVAVEIAEGRDAARVVRTEDEVRAFLGPAPHGQEHVERTSDPGVATGLAWTPVGGQILFVEATRMPGKGKLTLTGQLGDVMKESAYAALSYVRANAERWNIPKDFLDKSDLHVHVPAGAMPKDGPSAGVTILSALVSMLTGICVRHDVGMTGEITLRGRVLPIGGLKDKVLAAHRAGIKRVIVPERNRFDLDDVPDEIKRELEFVFVTKMDQVVEAALEMAPSLVRPAALEAGIAATTPTS